ncbi:MAG: response regulator, partial [Spirochaetales bacterium]|nr:response regulator [Spirochaetales bacterium]
AVLHDCDVHVVTALSGQEALAYLIEHRPALIVLDVQMPGMNGYELADLIRSRNKTTLIPIVFITAISTEERYVFEGYESGAVDYLSKPVDPFILRSKVLVFAELFKKEQRIEEALREREVLIREVHHRVKNNLTMLVGMINLQLEGEGSNASAVQLRAIKDRMQSILTVHDKLYNSEDLNGIALSHYMEELAGTIVDSYWDNNLIEWTLDCPQIALTVDRTIYLGIIVTELITNSIKHAASDTDAVHISIRCDRRENELLVAYSDSGSGVSEDVAERSSGLGFKIIRAMITQLDGRLTLSSSPGCAYTIAVPILEAERGSIVD